MKFIKNFIKKHDLGLEHLYYFAASVMFLFAFFVSVVDTSLACTFTAMSMAFIAWGDNKCLTKKFERHYHVEK